MQSLLLYLSVLLDASLGATPHSDPLSLGTDMSIMPIARIIKGQNLGKQLVLLFTQNLFLIIS